jgi:hypothetical protein
MSAASGKQALPCGFIFTACMDFASWTQMYSHFNKKKFFLPNLHNAPRKTCVYPLMHPLYKDEQAKGMGTPLYKSWLISSSWIHPVWKEGSFPSKCLQHVPVISYQCGNPVAKIQQGHQHAEFLMSLLLPECT